MEEVTKYILPDELYHHGIRGQKWGDRNGPPYPLDKKEHFQVIKRSKKDNTKSEKRTQLTDEELSRRKQIRKQRIKKAAMAGAVTVGAMLVTYGGYRVYKNKQGKIDISDLPSGNIFSKKVLDSCKKANPYQRSYAKIFSDESDSYNSNCPNCALAFIARMKGMNVQARANPFGATDQTIYAAFKNIPRKNIFDVDDVLEGRSYKDIDGIKLKQAVSNKLKNSITDNEAYGFISMPFTKAGGGGHIFNWVKQGDEIIFVDAQQNKNSKSDSSFFDNAIFKWFGVSTVGSPLTIARVDNVDFSVNANKFFINSNSHISNKRELSYDSAPIREMGKNFIMDRYDQQVNDYYANTIDRYNTKLAKRLYPGSNIHNAYVDVYNRIHDLF